MKPNRFLVTIKGYTRSTSAPAVYLFIVASLFVAFCTSANFDLSYAQSFLNNNITLICLCIGEGLVVLTGGIDISLGSIVSMCNVLIVTLINGGVPVGAAIVVMLAAAVIAGGINGIMVGVMRINPLLTTYATSIIYGGAALVITRTPIFLHTTVLSDFYMLELFEFLPLNLIFILIPYAIWKMFKRTPAGTHLYAVGENEYSAYSSGINVVGMKVFVYCFSGLTAGISALAITSMIQGGNPLLGESMSLTAVSAVVIGGVSLSGGKGDLGGGIFGCMFLFMLSNIIIFLGVNTFWQELLKTLILLITVVISVVLSDEQERTKIKKGLGYVRKPIGSK